MKHGILVLIAAAAALASAGCNTMQQGATRQPTAAELHEALERCKAENAAYDYAAVCYCFAEARRELEGRGP